ncbi:MAG: glutamate synthase large subunit [Nitrospirae bacterium]|nr:glutamate synthase large subunit [Nitrospirota bacterium]
MRTPPRRYALYDPAYEHDACGVGFIAQMKGEASHAIVEKGIQILNNLTHRGACGCDPLTGDGAGIMIQMPHAFMERVGEENGFRRPKPGRYAAGLVFLPRIEAERVACSAWFEEIVRREGQQLLGWRDVPVDPSQCGKVARTSIPHIRQIFIAAGRRVRSQDAFERKLLVIRKQIENKVRASGLKARELFHVPSLSSRTLIYKGLLISHQIPRFYLDLNAPDLMSAIAMVHQRFSTNTFPSWDRAHPYRYICHNGEINTLRGNINWMHAREALFRSPLFGRDISKILPVITPGGSDSAMFDNALELLVHTGRPIAHAIMMMIPEAWQNDRFMDDAKRGFYEYHACLMEPWDGPASIAFCDGRVIGAVLDRNGLRPSRYVVTRDDHVVMASEVGVLDVPPEDIVLKGRLQPGRMFLVDTAKGRIVPDGEIKDEIASRRPYAAWMKRNLVPLEDLPRVRRSHGPLSTEELGRAQRVFGYTLEDLRLIMAPMALNGQEAVGSMGVDTPLAVLSNRPQLVFNYFKQLFAQVTNPPIDPLREDLVMSVRTTLGPERNLFEATPTHARHLRITSTTLSNEELERLKGIRAKGMRAEVLPILFPTAEGETGLERALEALCAAAARSVKAGVTHLILSDRGFGLERVPIPSLLAVSAVHHHLIRGGLRVKCALILESGEPREINHFSLLMGYGCGAFNPYVAYDTIREMVREGIIRGEEPEEAVKQYRKAIDKGVLKVATKMGISTLQSYRGAQIFEVVGLRQDVVDRYFTWTTSRVQGVGLDVIARESLSRHRAAFGPDSELSHELDVGGVYQWRRRGEYHLINPDTVAKLQHAVRETEPTSYREFAEMINDQSRRLCTLRGLLKFKTARTPLPPDQVEPAKEIVKRFATGAMSLGSISRETHETLAIAMNRIGAKSNTGEGGEDAERYIPDPNGDSRRSAVKQVASGRFGVTINYLVHADDLQIKIVQGAKPGEGGQLPGHKVSEYIAKVRCSVPGVGLISPPPHHDIYSIEDISQLIHDLKNANSKARIHVKLVAEVGVGTVAAGVAKAKADVVLISGFEGGTGASPLTSIQHAGLPWELGVAETQQVLVMNGLRSRIVVQTDGKIMTGRDVAVAALLGAEEFGFSTAPLVSLGCVMMRVCHLNTCPVGIATQDPVLRQKFAGKAEHVINYFFFVAEELREIMARLGFRTVAEMIGRVDRLEPRDAVDHWKAKGVDLSALLARAANPFRVSLHCTEKQDHGLDQAMDHELIRLAKEAIEEKKPVEIRFPIQNSNRCVGTMLSGEIAKRYGDEGLPKETVQCYFKGSAGQSFGAFLAHGVSLTLEGDANDYIGKGLSGGRIVAFPPRESRFKAEENILIGNVALYGATAGEAYFRGIAGERFAVRNSGAVAVVEGVGDHGCEYMTRGTVVVLGRTGRNFAAGMSGGVAYVMDTDRTFKTRCNLGMVELQKLTGPDDQAELRRVVQRHVQFTGSAVGRKLLDQWERAIKRFVKVMPVEYKKILQKQHLSAEAIRLASV